MSTDGTKFVREEHRGRQRRRRYWKNRLKPLRKINKKQL
jgi:hypothetical protein